MRRHTSQSGFRGFRNQGSAQPRSTQLWIVRGRIFAPSSSKRGSFPPGWFSPRPSQRICMFVGTTVLREGGSIESLTDFLARLLSTIFVHPHPPPGSLCTFRDAASLLNEWTVLILLRVSSVLVQTRTQYLTEAEPSHFHCDLSNPEYF